MTTIKRVAPAWMGGLLLPALALGQQSDEGKSRADAEKAAIEAKVEAAVAKAKAEVEVEAQAAKAKAAEAKAEAETRAAKARTFEFRAQADAARAAGQQYRTARLITTPGRMGLEFATVSDAIQEQVGLPKGQGVVVVTVIPGGEGERAGFKANDLVLEVDGKPVGDVGQARTTLDRKGSKELKIKVIRGGKETNLDVPAAPDGTRGVYTRRMINVATSKPETVGEYWLGVSASPVDATLRSHLTGLPDDAGLIVNEVVDDSPAAKAGLKKNDILVKMGDKPLTTTEALVTQVRGTDGKPQTLEYLRAGKSNTLTLTPEKHEVAKRGEVVEDVVVSNFLPQAQTIYLNGQLAQDPGALAKLAAGQNAANLTLRLAPQVKEVEDSSKRIEAAVKELSAKLDEVRKVVDQLRKEKKGAD